MIGLRIKLLILLTGIYVSSFSQSRSEQLLLASAFDQYQLPEQNKRTLLRGSDKSALARYNPLRLMFSGFLYVYQNVISEQFQSECMYEISCSEYTKRMIGLKGPLKGLFIGLDQFSSCIPGASDDHLPHMLSPDLKLKNSLEFDK